MFSVAGVRPGRRVPRAPAWQGQAKKQGGPKVRSEGPGATCPGGFAEKFAPTATWDSLKGMTKTDSIPGGWSRASWHVLTLLTALACFFLLGPQPYVWSLGGRLVDATSGVGGIWTLGWLERALFGAGLSVWSPPALYPLQDTLALGQPLFGCLPLYLPVSALSGNPTLALNITILGGVLLSAYLMFLLVRRLGGNPWASLVAGLLFAFNPLQWAPAPVGAIPGSFFWAPLALLALDLARGGRPWALWLAAAPLWVLLYTTPAQGVGLAAVAAALLAVYLWRGGRDRRLLLHGAGVAAASVVVAMPLMIKMGARGAAALMERITTPGPVALFTPPGEGMPRVYGWLSGLTGAPAGGVFPGMALIILLLLAWAASRQGARGVHPGQVLLCALGALAAPGALGMPLLLVLCVSAGLSLTWIAPRISGRPLPGRLALAAALLAAVNLDYWLVETEGLPHGPGTYPPEVYSYLQRSSRTGPVLELPGHASQLAYHGLHRRPILAGPPWWRVAALDRLLGQVARCPGEACRVLLRGSAAETVVLHASRGGGAFSALDQDLAASGFRLMGQVGVATVWERTAAPDHEAGKASEDPTIEMPPPLPPDALDEGFEKSELKAMDDPPKL